MFKVKVCSNDKDNCPLKSLQNCNHCHVLFLKEIISHQITEIRGANYAGFVHIVTYLNVSYLYVGPSKYKLKPRVNCCLESKVITKVKYTHSYACMCNTHAYTLLCIICSKCFCNLLPIYIITIAM